MAAHLPAPLSAVLIHQGSPGGIGQVELLLDRAFAALGVRTSVIRRNTDGSSDAHMGVSARKSKIGFGLRAIGTVMKRRPELVVFSHLNLVSLALPLKAAVPGIRMSCVAHGIEAWSPLAPSARIGVNALDAVWCVSEFTRGMLNRESAITLRKLHVLPLAVADDKARLIESHRNENTPTGSRPFQLLSVTRLHAAERYKGIEHVLSSLVRVRSVSPNISYRLVGEGPDRAVLHDFAGALGISDVVTSDGAFDDDQLAAALNACNAFILPSAKEGFGLAHLEAMCAAKPVIAAYAGATPELIDRSNGVLTRYADVEGLADAILQLMSDRPLCESLGAAGRSRFQASYTEASFQAHLNGLLERL